MTGKGSARSEEAADFVEFAAARQGPALRAAVLVTGERTVGEQVVLGALGAVAAHWSSAREEGPDRWLRRALYREALMVVSGPSGDSGSTDVTREAACGAGVDELREAVRAVLHGLDPRVRAVAVLRWLEERSATEAAESLGVTADVVAADLAVARTALSVAVDAPVGTPPPTDDAARQLLELVADEVPEVDLARAAWDAARARRRSVRRRVALAGGGVVVGGVAAGILTRGAEPVRRPRPSTGPTVGAADGRLSGVPVAGATVLFAPDPLAEPLLPRYPDAAGLALPERLGPGPERPLEILSPAGSPASVRAVYLVRVGDDAYQPALLLPGHSAAARLVAMAPLRRVMAGGTFLPPMLGPRTIDADRHRLVVAQPGAVVVLEVRSADIRRFPVRDDALRTAGWATDGQTVVASNGSAGWLVDTRSGQVTRAGGQVNAGSADIAVSGGRATIRSYSDRGRLESLKSMEGPVLDVYGESVSTTEGWACRGAYVGGAAATSGRMQGLVAVQNDLRPTPRILAAPARGPHTTYRPLGWGPRDTVLLESWSTDEAGAPVLRVLAWAVLADRLYRVAAVDPPEPGVEQAFTGVWAL